MAAVVIVIVAMMAEVAIEQQARSFELQEALENGQSLKKNVVLDNQQLTFIANDFSSWDETYFYVENGTSKYFDSQVEVQRMMGQIDVQIMIVINASLTLMAADLLVDGNSTQMPMSIYEICLDQSIVDRVLGGERISGLYSDNDRTYMVAMNPVQMTGGQGTPNGVLLIAREFERDELDALSDRMGWPVVSHDFEGIDSYGNKWSSIFKDNHTASYYQKDGHLVGAVMLDDILGRPALVLEEVEVSHSASYVDFANISYLPSLLIIVLIFPLTIIIVMRRLVLNRLVRLEDDVRSIERRKDGKDPGSSDHSKLDVKGDDEIANLTISINAMLASIDESKRGLESSERRYRAIIEDQTDMLIRYSVSDLRITFINPSSMEFMGWSEVSYEMLNVRDLISPTKTVELREALEKLRPEAPTMMLETDLVRFDGQLRTVQWQGRGLFDEKGELYEVQAVGRDITDYLRLQEEIMRSQKLEALGSLAGGIAHDFNNMLASILGATELLRQEGGLDEKGKRRVDELESYIGRASLLARNLITFSKGGEPVKAQLDMALFLRNTAELSLVGSNVSYALDCPIGTFDALADESQMFQVMYNLLINARQVMPNGGKIEMRCRNLDTAPEPTGPGRYVQIEVRDNGPGISPENLDRIWEPFFTTRPDGNGLGLSIVRSIIVRHGGTISVSSDLGKGTVFTIVLPGAEHVDDEKRADPPTDVRSSAKVLLMDDDDAIVDVTVELLRSRGLEVDYALNGEEALRKYAAAMWEQRCFDVVIMDLTIKGGIGGKEAVQLLRRVDPGAKVIVSSGYSDDPVMANHRQYGFDAVVPKPYRIDEMMAVINDLLVQDRE